MIDVLGDVIFDFVAGTVRVVVLAVSRRRAERKARARGEVYGMIRSADRAATGVETHWRRVSLRAEPGRLFATDGVMNLTVIGLTRAAIPDDWRDPPNTGIDAAVLTIHTPGGPIDWVVPRADVTGASTRLGYPL